MSAAAEPDRVNPGGDGPADGDEASGDVDAQGRAGALVIRRAPTEPRAAVLLLHGGREDALEPPPLMNLPALRMRPFASDLVRATSHERVLIGRVRYRHRGWNGPREDAVHDARRALRALLDAAGPVPVVLVGHSMGARAALRVAGDDPQVRGVVALAPWCPPGEAVGQLRDRMVAALHDPADRVTQAAQTWEHLTRASAAGARTLGIRMPGGGHAMLRDARTWQRIATSLTRGMLGLAPLPDPLTRQDHAEATYMTASQVLAEMDGRP
ncbi:alpha/beta fold hydrolase [Streptomyces sp. SID4919]|uniref:alpha/beta hydrolase n=1 Tax=unclassified Streptomyces TaxID=2593676 RepID=UPI00082392AC|nr:MULTISPECIES: alpha/beta fold hydrolase [unclassified Streptomyces]MYY12342.1 alpha/beta fold hydrolase [Streptomyces sp. SID4919]SCK53900.1 Lysophospholipase [Streptomyces sp. AmelKG-E11A]